MDSILTYFATYLASVYDVHDVDVLDVKCFSELPGNMFSEMCISTLIQIAMYPEAGGWPPLSKR